MATRIIDGATGQEDIYPSMVALVNSKTYGYDDFVPVPAGDNRPFYATIIDNNHVQIASGVGYLQGRRFFTPDSEIVQITNGVSGTTRYTDIVARYSCTAQGIESIVLGTVDGAPDGSLPVLTQGDISAGEVYEMPIARIVKNGIAIGDHATLIYNSVPAMAAMEADIMDRNFFIRQALVSTVPGGSMTFYRSGNVVMAVHPTKVYSGLKTGQKNILLDAGGIPMGFRPLASIRMSLITVASHIPNTSEVLEFGQDGSCGVWIANTNPTEFNGAWTFLTEDPMPM